MTTSSVGGREHHLRLLKAMMTRMRPEDLSTDALAALVDLLSAEHAKFIRDQAPTPHQRASEWAPALGGSRLRIVNPKRK